MAILALGNPLLDIVVEVEPELLDRYGLELNNAVQAEEKHRPLFQEAASLPSAKLMGGGMLLNAIRAAQWMLQAPGATAFAGCVGTDGFAEELRGACLREGVRCAFAEGPAGLPTGCCAVLTRAGDRALCTELRAARSYTVQHLEEPSTFALLVRARVVYCAVLFPAAVARRAAEVLLARDSGSDPGLFCVSLSAPFVPRDPALKSLLVELLPLVDVLFGNEREALAWADTEGWDTTDVPFVATRLSLVPGRKRGKRVVVITRGGDAAVVAVNGHVTLHPVAPVPRERIVDTAGAGDCYAGGFLAALSKNLPLAECCKAGAFAASAVIQHAGCRFPDKSEYAW